ATTVTSVGPAYIFRNVWNRAQMYQRTPLDSDDRQPFFKSGSDSSLGDGRRYVFHNTMLQAVQPGLVNTLGGGFGMGGTGSSQLINNTFSRNNIYHLWKPGRGAVYQAGAGNQFSNDLYNGTPGDAAMTNGLSGTPVYAAGHGWTSEANGNYQIAAGTPGHGQGVRIANFNDGAAAPDVGAHQSGTTSMRFGIAAATSSSSTGGVTGPIVTPPPAPPPPAPPPPIVTPPPAPPPAGSGSTSPSLGLNASTYALSAGSSVTFIVTVSGNSGTPTGIISFRSNGVAIANCGSVGLSNGGASCTTASLSGGSHAITGVYSGDSKYAVGQAGPITVGVTGGTSTVSLPTSFGMDSSSYTTSTGQSVTFTASIPGNGGTALFLAGGAAISGCGAVVVTNGRASCTTSGLGAGDHAIKAVYSGSGAYGAGTAGPITQTVKAGFTIAGPALNVQGLWWGSASESGWGVNLTHQGNIVFATWFTYDAAGNGQWLVMSHGAKTGDNTFAGTLYRTTGPAFSEAVFDPARVALTAVGSANFAFTDSNNATFTATVDGVTVSKPITRQVYGAQLPTCSAGGSPGAAPNYQDLWWRPGGTESGWGLNLTHQGDVLFMTWFTYDQSGKGMWLVASKVSKTSNGNYSGTLYRTTGPAFNSASWDPSRVSTTPVGSVSFSFGDANNGVFSYTLNGISQSKPITREVFSTPATVCS
ncbi:MAG: Ig-like domain-containing protein, partial [Pseudomonadota bacterium]|nr:Ig-like domain-containing protein [Pseudomonadota bacterium]